ncbi:hypothetical protein B1812_09050 [Methylocystis bryophila]|uniref:Uncharacterized protein n=1 Tax=Methylocystis bryophila TaxID=655015 RepID=A0A1W6MUB9_9HYPH|nr:hypothetical protein B1812_09050 [Methylocystis bryophila]
MQITAPQPSLIWIKQPRAEINVRAILIAALAAKERPNAHLENALAAANIRLGSNCVTGAPFESRVLALRVGATTRRKAPPL